VDLLDFPEDLREPLNPFLPNFQSLLYDLSRVPDEAMPGKPYARLAQLLMKHQGRRSPWATLRQWTDLITFLLHDRGSGALHRLLQYAYCTGKEPPGEGDKRWAQGLGEEAMKAWKSAADQLKESARAEGQVLGSKEVFCLILRQRFGPLPDHFQSLINEATLEQVLAWAQRVHQVQSPEELFELPPAPQA